MKVGILSDGKPGHLNQSLGIVNILAEDLELDFIIINLSLKNLLFKPVPAPSNGVEHIISKM